MPFGRRPDALYSYTGDLFHLAPIPVIYHEHGASDLENFHVDLISAARSSISEAQAEVPDVRHVDMGMNVTFDDDTWAEEQVPAIGVWHGVPTNGFLNLGDDAVTRLRSLVIDRFKFALQNASQVDPEDPWISESWIQFYKNGDYKVLHNHERYGPPYPEDRWSGAYYIADGNPDPSMPYSGMFSFRVRQANYYIRPKAGLLVMWPADILHEVTPFYGKNERIVVNFNINSRPL
jgi:hypothetical protein